MLLVQDLLDKEQMLVLLEEVRHCCRHVCFVIFPLYSSVYELPLDKEQTLLVLQEEVRYLRRCVICHICRMSFPGTCYIKLM
jgi:hypothetical protein